LYELQAVVRALKPYKLFIKTNKSDEYWLKNYFDFEVIPPYSFNRKEKNYAKRK